MDITLTAAGFLVGAVVGMTGVGGGALMTPFLILYGVSPVVAVGTDLVYAAITKAGGLLSFHRNRCVHWPVVALLALGSLPASGLALWLLKWLDAAGIDYGLLVTRMVSVGLILTSLVLLFKGRLGRLAGNDRLAWLNGLRERWATPLTIGAGVLLGVLVTLSSVGAGALGAAMLFLLHPRLPVRVIVGTDLAHAVPLAALAGAGHLHLGSVDVQLLGYLLLGSLPGVMLGARAGRMLPEATMRGVLGTVLLSVGVGLAL